MSEQKHNIWRHFLKTLDQPPKMDEVDILKLENLILRRTYPAELTLTRYSIFGVFKQDFLQWSTVMIVACLCGVLLGDLVQNQSSNSATAAAYLSSYGVSKTTNVALMLADPWTRSFH